MMVSKTVSIGITDLNKIKEEIESGKYETFSKFIRTAIKNELKGR
jgi:Arc/MetJ-type ribon-helix-helix transcriptional regulator